MFNKAFTLALLIAGFVLTPVLTEANASKFANEKVCSFRGNSYRGDTRVHCWSLTTSKQRTTWTKRIKLCNRIYYTGSIRAFKDELRARHKLALVRGSCGGSTQGKRRCNVICGFRFR